MNDNNDDERECMLATPPGAKLDWSGDPVSTVPGEGGYVVTPVAPPVPDVALADLEAVWAVANERYGDVGMDAYSPADAMRAVLDHAEEVGRREALAATPPQGWESIRDNGLEPSAPRDEPPPEWLIDCDDIARGPDDNEAREPAPATPPGTPHEQLIASLQACADEVSKWPQWMRDAASTAHIFKVKPARLCACGKPITGDALYCSGTCAQTPEYEPAATPNAGPTVDRAAVERALVLLDPWEGAPGDVGIAVAELRRALGKTPV